MLDVTTVKTVLGVEDLDEGHDITLFEFFFYELCKQEIEILHPS